MQQKNVAFRKRTQISMANRTMFIWVACVSVVFGVALVASIFLVQILIFNEKVLAEKNKTITTLDLNIKNIEKLESSVKTLNFNESLNSIKAKSDDQPLQVVLDALPSDVNSLALGASLQRVLLYNIPGLSLDKLMVEPVEGIENLKSFGGIVDGFYDEVSDNIIRFSFSVTGDSGALRKVLQNLENSIRTIKVVSMKIESQNQVGVLTVQARAYYEPMSKVELKDKVIK